MGAFGAFCFHTLTPETRQLSLDQWDSERLGQVCGQPSAFADLKKEILSLCNISQSCTYEQRAAVAVIAQKMDQVRKMMSQ